MDHHCTTPELDAFIAEVSSFLAETGMAPSTFGLMAVNNGKFVAGLYKRRNVTTRTIGRVRAAMAAHRDAARTPANV